MAKALDPTPPGRPSRSPATRSAGCQTAYAPLDVIGVNDYFGWYPGPGGQIFDRTSSRRYLDSVRALLPDARRWWSPSSAPRPTATARSRRRAPTRSSRTSSTTTSASTRTKPWLSGAIYWALNEFRVRPGWEGGNPRPQPPLHQKGLLALRHLGAQARVGGRAALVHADRQQLSAASRLAPR